MAGTPYCPESGVLRWTLPLVRPGPLPGSLGCPGCVLWGLDSFLVNQSGCGNLPVQFVGTKVAFVTQITATYQLKRGALELVGGEGRCGAGRGALPPGGELGLPRECQSAQVGDPGLRQLPCS